MRALGKDELFELEHRGWRALCSGQGGAFYGELMLPDAVMVLVNGAVMGRDEVAASLDAAPPWARYELSDERHLPMGDDAAALIYRAVASRDDGAGSGADTEPFTALMSSVYRRVDGRPRLALYQQTTITH
ncbi:nuclear transport factor 2 family protein [Streptomyces sp. MS2A]|nr:nuclear transport factor 2 family protein [Streptomyces sp. MS2A]